MWEAVLFLALPFATCVVLAGILCYLGMHVLEREIIFIDITLAQIAATGSTAAVILFRLDPHEGSGFAARLAAIGFTFIAAAFFAFVAKRVTRISQETVIGVSYAIAAAATLFLLATAAGSDVHMEEMFTGSILWIQWPDLVHCALVFAAAGLVHVVFRKQFVALSCGSFEKQNGSGHAVWWDFLFYAVMGVVITYSVEFAGVLLTFSFLIIPATLSALFARGWKARLLIAWSLGTVVSVGGLAFSYRFDFSTGPSIVSLLGVALVCAAVVSRIIDGKRTTVTGQTG